MGELFCLLVKVIFYLIKRKFHLSERLLRFTNTKFPSEQGYIENYGALLTIIG